jgi:hypothetical protein
MDHVHSQGHVCSPSHVQLRVIEGHVVSHDHMQSHSHVQGANIVHHNYSCKVAKSVQACMTCSNSDPSNPSAPILTLLHRCAALAAQVLCTLSSDKHSYKFQYPTEAYVTTCDASHSLRVIFHLFPLLVSHSGPFQQAEPLEHL